MRGALGDHEGRGHSTVGSLVNRLRGLSQEGTVIRINGAGVESEGGSALRGERWSSESRWRERPGHSSPLQ